MDLWSSLDRQARRWHVLEHPFYERWSAGALTQADLATYASEYRHAVIALADESAAAAAGADDPHERDRLAQHAAEEAAHIALWERFARAVGADLERSPTPETTACARAWAGAHRSFTGHLAALYAVESAQPAISATKADGLRRHYGLGSPDATAYFDVHAERDVEHAAEGRELLARHARPSDAREIVSKAGRVLKANWTLRDGVERTLSRA
jgi:pyrroloquinoline-quinone synthase